MGNIKQRRYIVREALLNEVITFKRKSNGTSKKNKESF